jgi:hypothetical protein
LSEDRKKFWVHRFQTRLLKRICLYLAIYLGCLVNLLFIWRLFADGPGNPIEQFASVLTDYAPALLILMALLPFLAYDAIRFSHHLVGPLHRFRKVMTDIAKGEPVRPIKLRHGDLPLDLRDDFNKMLNALQKRGIPVLKPNDGDNENQQQTA